MAYYEILSHPIDQLDAFEINRASVRLIDGAPPPGFPMLGEVDAGPLP